MNANVDQYSSEYELVSKARDQYAWTRTPRKRKALERRNILESKHEGLILGLTTQTHYDAEIVERIRPWISVALNPAADVVTALANCYKAGVYRRVVDASPEGGKAFSSLYEESRFDGLAQDINRFAWFIGPTLEVPGVARGRFRRYVIPSDRYDVTVDRDDPLGQPLAASFRWWEGEDVAVYVDREKFSYYKIDATERRPYRTVEHKVRDASGEPAFPCTEWRVDAPTDPWDRWGIHRHARLVRGSLEVGLFYSLLAWVRKTQNRNVLSFFGSLERMIKDQAIEPERPFVQDTDTSKGEATPTLDVKNNDLSPENARRHIMLTTRGLVEGYGVPQSAVTFDFSEDTFSAPQISLIYAKLAEVRNPQLPFLRECEWLSAWKAVEVARAFDHPLAAQLPSAQHVRDGFTIRFPELARVDDPKEGREQFDWDVSRGQKSWIDKVLERQPDLSREEAARQLFDVLEEQSLVNDLVTSRDMARRMDQPVPGVQTAAEANGAMGPRVRDGARDDDDRSRPQDAA